MGVYARGGAVHVPLLVPDVLLEEPILPGHRQLVRSMVLVPDVADPAAPTVRELAAGVDLTRFLARDDAGSGRAAVTDDGAVGVDEPRSG